VGELRAYVVRSDRLKKAIGSGDERLLREVVARFAREIGWRTSAINEWLEGKSPPSIERAIGEVVDGTIRSPSIPEPYVAALEMICRVLGEPISTTPSEGAVERFPGLADLQSDDVFVVPDGEERVIVGFTGAY